MAKARGAGSGRKRSGAGRVWSIIGKVFGTTVLVGFLTVLIFICMFVVYIKNDLSQQVDFSVEGFALDQTSVIYYQDKDTGDWKVLKELYGEENRVWVSYEDMPSNLKFACIAIEDKRFRDHQGVDWLRTAKASVNLFLGAKDSFGASTITQQLIKNLTHEDEVTVRRKLVEIFRALEFEKKYTKEDILEWYLNIIPLGQRCYGVQSAAKTYFGKDVEDLSLAECASLIGITNNPSIYDPYINPEKNKKRQEDILYVMYQEGFIDRAEYEDAIAEELVFGREKASDGTADAYFSWFEDQVIDEVVRDLMAKTGYEYDVALQMLQTGGYKIYSTIDVEAQAAVDEVYENLENIPDTASSQQLQSAIVITDQETGDIVAMAGGVGHKSGSLIWNRATQSYLQPGSIIKPITVYAPALEEGIISPATVYDDTPYQFTNTAYWPKNSDSTYSGLVSINDAVCRSLNTVAVRVLADVGLEDSFRFATEKMGLTNLVEQRVNNDGSVRTDIDLGPLSMGGGLTRGVTVREMTASYGTFANDGIYREARTYTRVTDSQGKVILDNTQDCVVAMSEMTAWYSTYMMENTVSYGTGFGAGIEGIATAGKTGTTGSDNDRWFAGYTPYYTAVVWCGYDDPEEIVLTDTTANPSVSLWHQVMEKLHNGLPQARFSRPTSVVTATYCCDSGKLATEACMKDPRGDRTVSGLVSLEDVPTESCDVHRLVQICAESGHVANEFCEQIPDNTLYEAGLLYLYRSFPVSGILVKDQSYVYYTREIPGGYFAPIAPEVDPISLACYIHSEEDLPDEEDEENEDGDGEVDLGELIEEWLSQSDSQTEP